MDDRACIHVPCVCSDPRTKNWLFVPPGQAQLASVGYLLMVWLGPKLMKNRKPFNLQALMVAYNVLLVTLSAYMFVEVGRVFGIFELSSASKNL